VPFLGDVLSKARFIGSLLGGVLTTLANKMSSSTSETKRAQPEKEAHRTSKRGRASKKSSVRLLLEFGGTLLKFGETPFDAPVSIALGLFFDFPFYLYRGFKLGTSENLLTFFYK
jgi:hypothetical protein